MRPFFNYMGGKWRLSLHLGAPKFPHVIEPFAGSAGFSVRWEPKQVTLVEKNPLITNLWKYLRGVTPKEIMRLDAHVDHVDDLHGAAEEAKWLVGFWLNKGGSSPRKQRSQWCQKYRDTIPGSIWSERVRERIASQVTKIRHWRIIQGEYTDIENTTAHWYVDPPYESSGHKCYKYHEIDYTQLAKWCQRRLGFIQVSEQEGAAWLPFAPFKTMKGLESKKRTRRIHECVWERTT